ncbi:M23 family metallopeptidase [Paenibacillus sp. FJAT-27812]|uniref:M23 family metallopeptidase n=1 Tax=Paenibacillus sp. FJAT-27812 TaxID=1684143 RepID=UPI0009EC81AE|nr:M23 family metallopeptidase [Paenibacillus sp. FJAT-27812]
MKKARSSTFNGAITISKTVMAAGALAVLITACGGENNAVTKNDPAGSPAVTQSEATDNQAATAPPVEEALKPEDLTQALLEGKYELIYERMSKDFQTQLSKADFLATAADFTKGVKSFEQVSSLQHNGGKMLTWVSDSKATGLTGVFDGEGTILGLEIKELANWPETDEKKTKIVYDLPLRGDWLVIWGGENVLINYHYAHESQRYAYDIVKSKEGYSYKGDPLKNESYYAFGEPILAPADGKVVAIVNDIPDNEPVGVMNEKAPAGNSVVIDHGGIEFSTLAHMKKGTVSVKVGDLVKRGDEIGKLGNSGNSSEAHLHFQVSNGANLFESQSININWKDGIHPVQGETLTSSK